MILLDTNAVIWIEQGHKRTRALADGSKRLYMSPVSMLELQFLIEAGRIRMRGLAVEELADREPWLLDDPPAGPLFTRALDVSWTRDPFDRLLVAHARLRGWRLATADGELLQRLSAAERFEL